MAFFYYLLTDYIYVITKLLLIPYSLFLSLFFSLFLFLIPYSLFLFLIPFPYSLSLISICFVLLSLTNEFYFMQFIAEIIIKNYYRLLSTHISKNRYTSTYTIYYLIGLVFNSYLVIHSANLSTTN
jgi:hypothetical protein